MKQILLRLSLLLLCFFYLSRGHSQSVKLGIQGGVLFAKLKFDPKYPNDPDITSMVGSQIALPIEISFGKIFAIQPEIMFGLQGTRTQENYNGMDSTSIYTGYYKTAMRIPTFEIPLLAKLKFGPQVFKMHLLAGPSIGFGFAGENYSEFSYRSTEADGTVIYSVYNVETDNIVYLKDDFQNRERDRLRETPIIKTNYNLHFGAGFDLNLSKVTIFLDGRYILGLNDLFPDLAGIADKYKIDARSRRMGISAGILFNL